MSVEAGAEPLPGLYLHVPFCSAICPYCDFAVRRGGPDRGGPFVDRLLREMAGLRSGELLPEAPDLAEAVDALVRGAFDTVYLGGGTPSVLRPADLERLLAGLRHHFRLRPETRLFLEANPEDVDPERLEAWRRAGVATLSLGVQSLDDDELRFLGRRHRAADAIEAARRARETGFATVSVDLIYGLPGQELAAWEVRLEQALDLGIDHLSLYELEIHPRTHFGRLEARGRLRPLPETGRAELFHTTHRRMEQAGWMGYEVSSFARGPEHVSRHNRKYWHHVPYLGLGPSAHSLLVDADSGFWRAWNEPAEPRWRKLVAAGTSPAAGWERLAPSALALEALMLGLRHRGGVDLERLEHRFGLHLERRNHALFESWAEAGHLERRDRRLLPTVQGMALADRLATEVDLGSTETSP